MKINRYRWNKGKLFYGLLFLSVLLIILPLALSVLISLETLKSSNSQSRQNQAMALESQIHYARLSNIAHSRSAEAENLKMRTDLLSVLSAQSDLSEYGDLLEETAQYLRVLTGDMATAGKDYFLYFTQSDYLLGTREGLEAADYADPRIFTVIENADPYDLQYAKTQFGPDDEASYLTSFVYTVYPGVLYITLKPYLRFAEKCKIPLRKEIMRKNHAGSDTAAVSDSQPRALSFLR